MPSKRPAGSQAGYERGCTGRLTALAGANLVCQAAGMRLSILGCSLKDLLPDDDMIESMVHAKRGFESSDDTLARKTIRRGPRRRTRPRSCPRADAGAHAGGPFPVSAADAGTPQAWRTTSDKDLPDHADEREREGLSALPPERIPQYLGIICNSVEDISIG